ncbi:hypothetical protein [Lacibacter sp.]|uniref:hypothetical protein n=1 Tax=Lacibacter sp. TaxID=1915409 RepID=UPI002B4AAF45|nr:hypothetical protein [Lacibacter sp.]HLP39543.1 hypothetical protein [Lacibacter sp.]
MKQLLTSIILLVLLFSCNPRPEKANLPGIIDSLAVPVDSATSYFPFPTYTKEQVKENKRRLDQFVMGWYSTMLFGLHEPVIYNYKGDNEIYRFTLLRSFEHPLTVRLQRDGETIKLFSKLADGAGGYEPGQIFWDTTFHVNHVQYDTLTTLIARADFWNMPIEIYDGGLDGAEWILEGVKDGKYHWAHRWSPAGDRHTNFKAVCEYVLSISKTPMNTRRR